MAGPMEGPESRHVLRPDRLRPPRPARRRRAADLAPRQYDFGDSWHHIVTVEARDEPDSAARYPQVLDGARACPPEDCGGAHGYARLIESLADPSDPEHGDMVQWAPDGFDPEAFDVRAHDAAARAVR